MSLRTTQIVSLPARARAKLLCKRNILWCIVTTKKNIAVGPGGRLDYFRCNVAKNVFPFKVFQKAYRDKRSWYQTQKKLLLKTMPYVGNNFLFENIRLALSVQTTKTRNSYWMDMYFFIRTIIDWYLMVVYNVDNDLSTQIHHIMT